MPRSYPELMGLEIEAERLVRMGESRAEVSRRLGVHPMTLAGWALRGGWRKKDLDRERSAEATRETILAIRRGNRAADAENRVRAEVAQVLREALRLLAEAGEEDGLARALKLVEAAAAPWTQSGGRLEPPGEAARVTLAPDPLVAGMRSLGDADVDRPDFGEVVILDDDF